MDDLRTAGEVIRSRLEAGAGKQTVAKELAGKGAEPGEIQRWRYVVQRAAAGREPSIANALHVGKVYGEEVRMEPRTRPAEAEGDGLPALHERLEVALNRQAQVLAALAALESSIAKLIASVDLLAREVRRKPRGRGREAG